MLYLVGLGPGNPKSLPPQAFALLTGNLPVYVRTARHPVFESGSLAEALPRFIAFDDEYETNRSFEDTYDAIVARVFRAYEAANDRDIVYAVPGHPLIGESTIARLLPEAKKRGIPVKVVGAPSFVDACLEAVGEAVTGDLRVVDALSLREDDVAVPEALTGGMAPVLLYQVHSQAAASQTKLALMRAGYPDEWPVKLIRAAGLPERETVQTVPLYELDRKKPVPDHLTSVWVPALPDEERRPGFADLVRVMARLRDKDNGCPWDLKQTHTSLKRYVLEEAYEVIEAIDALNTSDDDENASDVSDKLCEELGDLLLQVVFHAQLASEEGFWDSSDVVAVLVEKLLRRHPHIFGEVKVADADDVLANWNTIKATEKGNQGRTSILDGIPAGLPALMRAGEISKRVVAVGFEWPDTGGVLDKVEEEFRELRIEIEANAAPERIADELGDLLFTLVNVARHLKIEPEDALRRQTDKFKRRFGFIEAGAKAQSRALDDLTLAEMEAFWQEAKQHEKNRVG